MNPAAAAAELLADHLSGIGVVVDAGFEGNVVAFTTRGEGVHLGNVHQDYDVDVHLACESGEINSGPLKHRISDEATVYGNMRVRGIAEDWEGCALPTHVTGKTGIWQKEIDNIPSRTVALCDVAGIELEW